MKRKFVEVSLFDLMSDDDKKEFEYWQKQQGMQVLDSAAAQDGATIAKFQREYAMKRAATRFSQKRKVQRGKRGAASRTGMVKVPQGD